MAPGLHAVCSVTGCANGLDIHRCRQCNRRFCRIHLAQHPQNCRGVPTHSSHNKLLTLIVSLIFFGVLLHSSKRRSPTSARDPATTTGVPEINLKITPAICSSVEQCPGPSIPFESSSLLTSEHQNYLNAFHNDTKSRISKWKLVYRFDINMRKN